MGLRRDGEGLKKQGYCVGDHATIGNNGSGVEEKEDYQR